MTVRVGVLVGDGPVVLVAVAVPVREGVGDGPAVWLAVAVGVSLGLGVVVGVR